MLRDVKLPNLKVTGSLVLYNSAPSLFEKAIAGFLDSTGDGRLYVVDNSPSPLVSKLFAHERVIYVHNGANIGFGAAHNRAIKISCADSDVHLILNPDIQFDGAAFSYLVREFAHDPALMAAMPKVVYPNGDLQRLCKLLPTPVDLLVRRFIPVAALRASIDARYEMHFLSQDRASEVPSLSGCFLLARSSALLKVGGFDERFFMYMEDVDLVRRLQQCGKTVYFPAVSVVHEYAKGSYRNRKLLGYHIRSAIKYFNKWGWLIDLHRAKRNRTALSNALGKSETFVPDFDEVTSK